MNFKITDSWLREYLTTEATPEDIQREVSKGGPSVERLEKVHEEWVYEIETTSNRVDAASVIGFARECAAILPLRGYPAALHIPQVSKNSSGTGTAKTTITITDPSLCSTYSCLEVSIQKGSKALESITKRLEACGIHSVSPLVDISNYVLIEYGMPSHIFDSDRIGEGHLSMRESKNGEKIHTLDGNLLAIPEGSIVMEDGKGALADLCGIMGGASSCVTNETKTILLFVPIYDKHRIRRTSMNTGIRTEAVGYFEKDLDPDATTSVALHIKELIEKVTDISNVSQVHHHRDSREEPPLLHASYEYCNDHIGTTIEPDLMHSYLLSLGFTIPQATTDGMSVHVPSHRRADVTAPIDIVEEIARLYGYDRIESKIEGRIVDQPKEVKGQLDLIEALRNHLAARGWHEQYNYSMISQKDITLCRLSVEDHISITNALSQEITHLRTSLVPSLVRNVLINKGKVSTHRYFEIARTYQKREQAIPEEIMRIGFISSEDMDVFLGELRLVLESIIGQQATFSNHLPHQPAYLLPGVKGSIQGYEDGTSLIGQLHPMIVKDTGTKQLSVAEIAIDELYRHLQTDTYLTPSPYARIYFDHTYTTSPQLPYERIEKESREISRHLLSAEVKSVYQNKVTVRFTFGYIDKNMTEKEAQEEFEKIKIGLFTPEK